MARTPPPADRTPEGWSRVADAYDEVVSPFLVQYAEDALELTDLQPGQRVLDVAAGSGALSLLAARRGADVLATDFAPGMVQRLRTRAEQEELDVEVACMDGQALEVEDGSFQAAYSNFGVIFFPDQVQGLRELHRAVAPGGRVAVTAWSHPDRVGFFRVFKEAIAEVAPDLGPPDTPPAAFSLADPDLLIEQMTTAGFDSVEVTQVEHAWEMATPEATWEAMTTTNPVMPGLMERLGPKLQPDLRAALLGTLRDRFGEGPVRFQAEAHVGIGQR